MTKTIEGTVLSNVTRGDNSVATSKPSGNNESICAELVKAGTSTPGAKKEIPATERVKDEPRLEDERVARSARGIIQKKDILQPDLNGKIGDQTCVICYAKKTNAVLMPCCHSGLCYECAIKISQNDKAICHFCRKVLFLLESASVDHIAGHKDRPGGGRVDRLLPHFWEI